MKGPRMKSGWRGSAPLLSFATEPLRNGKHIQPHLSLFLRQDHLGVREKRGAICIDVASPVGISQRKCSCLDMGDGRTLEGYRECWCTSSLQPHLALVSHVDTGQRVHWKPPSWIDHGD